MSIRYEKQGFRYIGSVIKRSYTYHDILVSRLDGSPVISGMSISPHKGATTKTDNNNNYTNNVFTVCMYASLLTISR